MTACDLIVFVVDGQTGLTPSDQELGRMLRRTDKPVILAVNKIDHDKHSNQTHEFSPMGFVPVMAISAEHDRGVKGLAQRISALLPADDDSGPSTGAPVKIALVGRPNVGKSSLTNAILQDDRTLVSPISGTTRDAVDIPYQRGDQNFILIDTAGIRPRGKVSSSVEVFSVMRSEGSIRRADLCVLVIDAAEGVTSQDKKIAGMIKEAKKPCVVAVNKWDLIEEKTTDKAALKQVLDDMHAELFFLSYAPLILLSAKTGASMERLFKRIENVREASRQRIGTGPLNRLIAQAQAQQPPAMRSGRRFKMLYATQPEPGKHSPIPVPEIVVFCNEFRLMDDSYQRFLENKIRGEEPWEGLPLLFRFRGREEKGAGKGPGKGAGKRDENAPGKGERKAPSKPRRTESRSK
ncbi:MAG: ribosome biogenesis GTPase Der, partial [Chthoniobacteraceae bacterium]